MGRELVGGYRSPLLAQQERMLCHHRRNCPIVTTGAGRVLEAKNAMKWRLKKGAAAAGAPRWEYNFGYPHRVSGRG